MDLKKEFGIECNSFSDFQKFIQESEHTPESFTIAKDILKRMLQTEGQLERVILNKNFFLNKYRELKIL